MPKQKSPPIPGLVYVTFQLPKELREDMKKIRQARRSLEKGEVRQTRIYREAVEYYLNARSQRELLKAYGQTQIRESDQPTEEPAEALYADQ